MIINEKNYNAKVEEFRRYYGVTYVDEEMHKVKIKREEQKALLFFITQQKSQ